MRPKARELTEKYKALRLQPEALFLSRTLQTVFSKFTKKGKKALARRHIQRALIRFRMHIRRPTPQQALLRILRRLRIQFLLVPRRKGREIHSVPVPVRRNKRDVLNIQALYGAMRKRTERLLSDRIFSELYALFFRANQSTTMRQRSAHLREVYTQRVNMEMRWK